MRPIPARHILAVGQAGLFAILMLIGQAQVAEDRAHKEIALMAQPPQEGAVMGWYISHPRKQPWTFSVAISLNLPAFLAETVLVAGLSEDPGAKLFAQGVMAVFVFALWYLIGRVIDRRRDLLPSKPATPPRSIRRVFTLLALLASVLLAAGPLIEFVLGLNYHEPGYVYLAFSAWFGLAAYALWRKLRGWRAASNPPSELRITP